MGILSLTTRLRNKADGLQGWVEHPYAGGLGMTHEETLFDYPTGRQYNYLQEVVDLLIEASNYILKRELEEAPKEGLHLT